MYVFIYKFNRSLWSIQTDNMRFAFDLYELRYTHIAQTRLLFEEAHVKSEKKKNKTIS